MDSGTAAKVVARMMADAMEQISCRTRHEMALLREHHAEANPVSDPVPDPNPNNDRNLTIPHELLIACP